MAAALAAFGLRTEGALRGGCDEPFYLWPEHRSAFELWLAVQTQWRVGMGGPTGLDYAGIAAHMRINRLRPRQQRERLAQLQTMERAALDAWAEERPAQRNPPK